MTGPVLSVLCSAHGSPALSFSLCAQLRPSLFLTCLCCLPASLLSLTTTICLLSTSLRTWSVPDQPSQTDSQVTRPPSVLDGALICRFERRQLGGQTIVLRSGPAPWSAEFHTPKTQLTAKAEYSWWSRDGRSASRSHSKCFCYF